MNTHRRWLLGSLCACLLVSPVVAEEDLKTLVESGRYAEAYEQAQAQLDQHIGEQAFDFWYGVAALEMGHPQEAVFALERVLTAEPLDQRARLELARAHFMLGNVDTAKVLFEHVLATEPPPRVQENIRVFLAKINQQQSLDTSFLSGSVSMSLGVDSNVNSATDITSVDIPFFGAIPLTEDSRASDDEFSQVAAGVNYLSLINKRMGYFLGAQYSGRHNFTFDVFDTGQVTLNGGLALQGGRHVLRFPVQLQRLEVDGQHFRDLSTLGAEWTYTADSRNRYAVFGQVGTMRYPDQEIRDAKLRLSGLAFSHELESMPLTLFVSAFYGDEEARQDAGDFHGRDYLGLRTGGTWKLNEAQTVTVALLGQGVEHDAAHPILSETRDETLTQLSLKWDWTLYADWLLGVNVDYTKNDSNVPLYTYDRAQEYVSLTYSF